MNFQTIWDYEHLMKSNGMYCGFNMPDAVTQQQNCSSLPPYAKRKSFLVDHYPEHPRSWMESSGTLSSYFVPVQSNKGMWLDFNKNFEHSHHVAIVISIQGVNPLTGLPCTDQYLNQYVEKCPKCLINFKPDRYCEKCGFHYPKQNYLTTTTTPKGSLWIDGFRSIDGIVRQYILTEEKIRGVAANICGEKRVFAIGISFFLSKEKKPIKEEKTAFGWYSPLSTPINWQIGTSSSSCSSSYNTSNSSSSQKSWSLTSKNYNTSDSSSSQKSWSLTSNNSLDSDDVLDDYLDEEENGSEESESLSEERVSNTEEYEHTKRSNKKQTKLEIGAGEKITQSIYEDSEELSFWKEKPEATIVVNYCLEEEAINIIKNGKVPFKVKENGFLEEILIGN